MRGARILAIAVGALALLALVPAGASARFSAKKGIWGPVQVDGVSQFPIYHDLGAGIWETQLLWPSVAATRPADPRNPADPAYAWPADLDLAVAEARKYGIRIMLELQSTPAWANGGGPPALAPTNPADFADFARAVARRYPSVHLFQILGEPMRSAAFITNPESQAPRRYAQILDAAYGQLKAQSKANLVIGGNTATGTGAFTPLKWIQRLKLPNGRRPRMDYFGHNPIGPIEPTLDQAPLLGGLVDFSSLPNLAKWVDKYLARPRHKKTMRLFLAEYELPTDHTNHETNFWVDRQTQAKWLAEALKIVKGWKRVVAMGYISLYDEPPQPDGQEVNRGLIDATGARKPAYTAFRDG